MWEKISKAPVASTRGVWGVLCFTVAPRRKFMLSAAVVGRLWCAICRNGSAQVKACPCGHFKFLTFTSSSPGWLCSRVDVSSVSLSLLEPKMMCVGLFSG